MDSDSGAGTRSHWPRPSATADRKPRGDTSVLARLEAVDPKLNAVTVVLAEQALAAADRADTARLRGEPLGLLHGVPVTIKENVDQEGAATANGVVAFKDVIATTDSPPVASWKRAGAIIIGRTNTPAFSLRWHTDNDLRGRTFNPWHRDRTPGGSSGGAAAALAVGITPLAHGNDLGDRCAIRRTAVASPASGRPLVEVAAYNQTVTEERPAGMQLMSRTGAAGPARRRRAPRSGRHGRTRPARCVVGAGAARRACSCATDPRGADHQSGRIGRDAGRRRGGARGRRGARRGRLRGRGSRATRRLGGRPPAGRPS